MVPFPVKNNQGCAKQTVKTCGRKLPVTSLANVCQKRSVKLLAIVKAKVYNIILAMSGAWSW
jgi:hypothetical protein